MIERQALSYDGYPCDDCDTKDACEDGKKVINTIVANKSETGCIKFQKWLDTPLARDKGDK